MGADTQDLIREECAALADMLVAKNRAYGDSAIRPMRVFAKSDPVEQIKVRLDDKLSRLARGSAAGEDVELDLLGYLILLRVARRIEDGADDYATGLDDGPSLQPVIDWLERGCDPKEAAKELRFYQARARR
jgi:hypothetical protein